MVPSASLSFTLALGPAPIVPTNSASTVLPSEEVQVFISARSDGESANVHAATTRVRDGSRCFIAWEKGFGSCCWYCITFQGQSVTKRRKDLWKLYQFSIPFNRKGSADRSWAPLREKS